MSLRAKVALAMARVAVLVVAAFPNTLPNPRQRTMVANSNAVRLVIVGGKWTTSAAMLPIGAPVFFIRLATFVNLPAAMIA